MAVNNRKFVIASEMLEAVAEKLEWENPEVLQTLKGSDLEYMVAKHPFYDRETLIMNADYVTLDSGTGLVHVAPGHGEDDYFAVVNINCQSCHQSIIVVIILTKLLVLKASFMMMEIKSSVTGWKKKMLY